MDNYEIDTQYNLRGNDRAKTYCHFDEYSRRNLFQIQRFLTRNTGILTK